MTSPHRLYHWRFEDPCYFGFYVEVHSFSRRSNVSWNINLSLCVSSTVWGKTLRIFLNTGIEFVIRFTDVVSFPSWRNRVIKESLLLLSSNLRQHNLQLTNVLNSYLFQFHHIFRSYSLPSSGKYFTNEIFLSYSLPSSGKYFTNKSFINDSLYCSLLYHLFS